MHILKKAFIGISIAGMQNASDAFVAAFQRLDERLDEIIFLVFDDIHLYNRVIRSPNELLPVTIGKFLSGPRYLEERTMWINRISNQIPVIHNCAKVRVLNVYSVTDKHCYKIIRNLFLLYSVDQVFRADILSAVNEYQKRSSDIAFDSKLSCELSIAYILEEIAINIRVRLLRRLEIEYYPGKCIPPLVDLYKGKYSASVYEIAERKMKNMQFDFFEWRVENDKLGWFLL